MPNEPRIIHEDDSLLVVDKPAGAPSASLKSGEEGTVAAWLLKLHPEQGSLPKGELEAGLVNRLDNETSGIIVAARTLDAYEKLRSQFADGSARKEYAALIVGHAPDAWAIDAPIAHHPNKKRKMVACESEERAREWKGRRASTRLKTLERYEFEGSEYTLVSIGISTGVRHQIRVHLAHIGHPIAGDGIYRNPKKQAEDPLKLDKHFLHASRLTIAHPTSGKPVTFESPLPEDLQSALNRLTHRSS